ncbi:MAG TPA: hypothetical protein VGB50_03820 [Flavobacterium sp.]|jgi:hypothetical protein
MKKLNSVSLVLMGVGLLPVAHIIRNPFQKSILLIACIILNLIGIAKVLKERKERNL